MSIPEDKKRYRKNFINEYEAKTLYEILASREQNPDMAAVYRKLAETEGSHARIFQYLAKNAQRLAVWWQDLKAITALQVVMHYGPGYLEQMMDWYLCSV